MTIYKEIFAYFISGSYVHFFRKALMENFILILIYNI